MITEVLIAIIVMTITKLYISDYWKRKKRFSDIQKLHGPTPLPFVGNAPMFTSFNNEDIHYVIEDILIKYPPPLRCSLGPQLIYITDDPDEIGIILNHPNGFEKENLFRKLFNDLGSEGIIFSPVARWKHTRKMLNPSFNLQTLNSYVSTIASRSLQLSDDINRYVGKGFVNILDDVGKCMFDIICETTAGIKKFEDDYYFKLFARKLEITCIRLYKIIYHIDSLYYLTALGKEDKKVTKELFDFTYQVIQKRKLELKKIEFEIADGKPRTFLDILLKLSEENSITDKQLIDEVLVQVIAGSDTVTTCVCFTLILLALHPDIQDKVYDEVSSVIFSNRPLDKDDLPNLKYLEMVLKESLRIFPVGHILSRHLTGDVKLENRVLPAGITVAIPLYHLHRNPKYYPEPLKFIPERFTPEESSKRSIYSWLAFSAGARNCIGMKYGMMAAKCIVATLIKDYKVTTSYKSIEEIRLAVHITMKATDGYNISFEKRA